MTDSWPVEIVPIGFLQPHPRNYRRHPADQIEHLAESIKEHGLYRPIVTAKDGTILAGHGIYAAALSLKLAEVPIHRMPLDAEEPRAIKVLTADNELGRFAESDDRLLSELLREVKDFDPAGLLGTGYDEMMLANLVMVTRSASEIADIDEAAHWVGMPGYEQDDRAGVKLVITFPDVESRQRYIEETELQVDVRSKSLAWSTRWPWTDREDLSALRFGEDE